MDFLTQLYSNENFGIILFITISILVLAFLIVLFFGKKDQKERQLAETKNLEINDESGQNAFQDELQPTMLEVPVPPVSNDVEQIKPEPPIHMEPQMEIPVPPVTEQPQIKANEEPIIPQTDFDFDALAESISKELETLNQEESKIPEPTIPKIKAEPTMEPSPVIPSEPKFEMPQATEKPKMPSQAPFSSVFVNRVETPKEEVKPLPAKPNIELPKTIELPKLSKEETKMPEPVIKNTTSNIVFPSIEKENSVYAKNDDNQM